MIPISFEFYPPKTDDQRAQLDRTAKRLKAHAPEYVSCTFGAGGSTLRYTPETVRRLHQEHGLEAAPHLSCVGGTREEIRDLLRLYRAIGCRRIVALRGDLPSGMGQLGDMRYASELVEFIRETSGDYFRIEVGCYPETHPQAEDAMADLRWFDGVEAPVANYFVVILYRADQRAKEGAAIDGDWGVVGCLYTAEPEEIPMAPITMMRNALGVEEGGSGVPVDRDAYRRAVEFWDSTANWRP